MLKNFSKPILITALFSMISYVYAENISTELSESKSYFSLALNPGETLTVKYNLNKGKITRADKWYTYVVQCESDGRIAIDYVGNFKNKQYMGDMWIASDHQSDQLIGYLIESQGVFTIQNIDRGGRKLDVECQLHPKFEIGKF